MAFLAVCGPTSPSLEVTVDFDNDPTSSTTTWTDVTPYLVSYSREPVRTNEFDQPSGAGGSLKLRNDDARFIPDNTSGPYYGKLKKLRRIRVRAQWNGVTYNRFWGYVQDWPQSWDMAGFDQSVTLELTDGFEPLKTFDLVGKHYAGTATGTAIAEALIDSGITAYSLDPGKSVIVDSGTLAAQSYALRRVQDIAASELGVAFADGGGTIQFHDRGHRTGVYVPSGTIGDAAGEIRYTNPQPLFGDAWPIVNVTPSGGTLVTSVNAAGTASFFQRTLNFPTGGQYLVGSQTEAAEAASYLSDRYGAPVTRIQSVTLLGARDTSMWPTILGLDTSALVEFKRRFLSNGTVAGTVDLTGFVEGYGDRVEVGRDWQVDIPMSPSSIQSFWLAGVSGNSNAGISTKAAPF